MDFIHLSTKYLLIVHCTCQALGQAEAIKMSAPGPDFTELSAGESGWTTMITAQREVSPRWTHTVVVVTSVGAEEMESKLAWGET